jgi:hypothetical protein
VIILQQDDRPLRLLAHGLQHLQRVVGIVNLIGLRIDQAVHDRPVTQLALLAGFPLPVEMLGDGFEVLRERLSLAEGML